MGGWWRWLALLLVPRLAAQHGRATRLVEVDAVVDTWTLEASVGDDGRRAVLAAAAAAAAATREPVGAARLVTADFGPAPSVALRAATRAAADLAASAVVRPGGHACFAPAAPLPHVIFGAACVAGDDGCQALGPAGLASAAALRAGLAAAAGGRARVGLALARVDVDGLDARASRVALAEVARSMVVGGAVVLEAAGAGALGAARAFLGARGFHVSRTVADDGGVAVALERRAVIATADGESPTSVVFVDLTGRTETFAGNANVFEGLETTPGVAAAWHDGRAAGAFTSSAWEALPEAADAVIVTEGSPALVEAAATACVGRWPGARLLVYVATHVERAVGWDRASFRALVAGRNATLVGMSVWHARVLHLWLDDVWRLPPVRPARGLPVSFAYTPVAPCSGAPGELAATATPVPYDPDALLYASNPAKLGATLEAFAAARAAHPGFVLYVASQPYAVGPGDGGLGTAVAAAGLDADSVVFLGPLSKADLYARLRASLCLFYPSLF